MANTRFLLAFLLLIPTACKKDNPIRDKFLGVFEGQRVCTNSSIGLTDSMLVTIAIEEVPKEADSLLVRWLGLDSAWAVQSASYGGAILDFVNNDFAGELNGDTLVLHDLASGYNCITTAVRQP